MPIEELKMKYPAGLEDVVHLTKPELEHHLRLMAALKMFELGKISTGKAAELAGMSRVDFFEACGRYRVSIFNYSDEDIEAELDSELATIKKLNDL